jgi:hypothetical protein
MEVAAMTSRFPWRIVVWSAAALLLAALWIGTRQLAGPAAAQSRTLAGRAAYSAPGGHVLMAWGVGGVLTDDGKLWQYRPEKARWVTIDESFSMDGEQRHVLPLPVAARDVQFMQGFGFLVTRGGSAWLYDLDKNTWRNIGAPGR